MPLFPKVVLQMYLRWCYFEIYYNSMLDVCSTMYHDIYEITRRGVTIPVLVGLSSLILWCVLWMPKIYNEYVHKFSASALRLYRVNRTVNMIVLHLFKTIPVFCNSLQKNKLAYDFLCKLLWFFNYSAIVAQNCDRVTMS